MVYSPMGHAMTGRTLALRARARRLYRSIKTRLGVSSKPRGRGAEPQRNAQRQFALGVRFERLSLPIAIWMLFSNPNFHPAYGLTWRRKIALGRRLYRNTRRITTGNSYRAHLAVAAKLFEMAPTEPGVVVECGSWKGGTTTNLSIICDIVGRDLIVYDSFEGLPAPKPGDGFGAHVEGGFKGSLETVQDNVRRFGVIARCQFRKGWFSDTLPHHTEPIALSFVDVDFRSSMHDCLVNLWPHHNYMGYMFFDEYHRLDNCALFYSEHFWREYLDTVPPGLMGTGTGIALGNYFTGPRKGDRAAPAIQRPSSIAYTRKDFFALWDYDPDRPDADPVHPEARKVDVEQGVWLARREGYEGPTAD